MDQNGKGGTRKLYHQGSKSEGPEQGAALLAIIRFKTFLLIIVACDGTLGCEDGSPRSGSDRNECSSTKCSSLHDALHDDMLNDPLPPSLCEIWGD
ncbi:hypothetical protein N7453_002905 [Penicillium expansum]|nr:hypothetical protein N7453_002905 [Penicillium expansum]